MRRSVLAATAIAAVAIAAVCWSTSVHDPESMDTADGGSPPAASASAARTVRRSAPRGARAAPPEPVADERVVADDEAKARIRAAAAEDRWNDALRELDRLGNLHPDPGDRRAIGLDALSAEIVAGRDRYFAGRIAPKVSETMDALIAANAKGEASAVAGTDGARPGTLAAARRWQNREMFTALWEKVAADLGLTKDELEKYWKSRRVAEPRTASYGAGSAVVVKRRPEASDATSSPPHAKPLTDEDWWSAADAAARGAWLTANFVETSGLFEVLRADDVRCAQCDGKGFLDSGSAHGDDEGTACPACGGCGVVRSVTYR